MDVLNEELIRDWRFEEPLRRGLPAEVLVSLSRFWSRPEFAKLARELRLPHRDWTQTTECLSSLLDGRQVGSHDAWTRVALASRQVAVADPVAAAIIALYPLARWEGVLGPNLYKEGWPGSPGLAPGWQDFPLVVAQNLIGADAFWAARRLARMAVEAIENSSYWNSRGRDPGATEFYRATLRHAERRYEECIENLAWDLHDSCRREQPSFRPEVAALFWSLGDVPHARLLQFTTLMPSREAVTLLVRRSLQVLHHDPAIQEIWLRLKDRPPFSLREHRELFVSINLYWANIRPHLDRGETIGQHRTDMLSMSEERPSRAYAAAATEFFQAGRVTTATRRRLAEAHMLNAPTLMMWAPEALHRLRSLITLVVDQPPPGTGLASQADRWESLAEAACAIVAEREHDVRDSYDRTLDIPFYYLHRDSPAALARALELTEKYRWAAMWFWRHVTPVPFGSPSPGLGQLRVREDKLIAEFQAVRFLCLLPFLPPGCAQLRVSDSPAGVGGPAPMMIYDADPSEVARLSEAAPRRARELERELDAVAREIAESDREYLNAGLMAHVTIEEFAASLGASRR